MIRITINNGTMPEDKAIKEALEINDQTGEAVEVCRALGDTVLYISENGSKILY